MIISSRFAVGVHILTLLHCNSSGVNTSEFIAGSVNTNPVVIRRITSMLGKAGLVEVRPGVAGAKLSRPLSEITLLDVYRAVNAVEKDELFGIHEAPNPACPVGRNIQHSIGSHFIAAQNAMEESLSRVTLMQIVEDIEANEKSAVPNS